MTRHPKPNDADTRQPESTVRLTILSLAHGGDGVARLDGKTVFVRGALPGEAVEVQIVEVRPNFLRAVPKRWYRRHDDRRELDCPHEGPARGVATPGCGGCGFRHVNKTSALRLKTAAALEEVRKVAPGLEWPEPRLHLLESPDGTRTRARFHTGGGHVGFHARGSHQTMAIPGCLALAPELVDVAQFLERLLSDCQEPKPPTLLVELADNGAFTTWDGAVKSHQRKALKAAINSRRLAGFRARAGNRSESFGTKWIHEKLAVRGQTLHFRRRPGTFAQNSPTVNRQLTSRLLEILSGLRVRSVVDLFAGSGNLSLVAGLTAQQVIAVEADPRALEGLAESIKRNAMTHVSGVRADLSKGLGRRLFDLLPEKPNAVLLDPPRVGAKGVVREVLELEPGHIIYVACSATHFARDAVHWADRYRVVSMDAFEMFPRTPHLELMTVFERRE